MSNEIKEVVQEIGEAFTEYKKSVDGRLEAIQKGLPTSDHDAKLARIDDAFDQLEGMKSRLEEMETKGSRPGMTDSEAFLAEHKKAFDQFVRKGDERAIEEILSKSVQVGVDADGGFAVPETLDTMIEQLQVKMNPMRGICNVMSVSNENYKKLVDLGGTASGWVGETAARPLTANATLAELTPFFGEIYANPAATQKSLDDLFFDVEAWLAEDVAREFAEKENLSFTSGSGTAQPKGILTYTQSQDVDGTRAFGEVQYRLSGTDSVLGVDAATSIDNLVDLTYDLAPSYRQGAQFVVSRDVLRLARKLKDADNIMIWSPSLQAGQPSTLLGYAVVENEDMPAAAAESNSVMFGDFRRAYTIVDVRGTRMLRDPFTNKPYVHFYTTKRVGGFLVNSEAVKVLRLGNGI